MGRVFEGEMGGVWGCVCEGRDAVWVCVSRLGCVFVETMVCVCFRVHVERWGVCLWSDGGVCAEGEPGVWF